MFLTVFGHAHVCGHKFKSAMHLRGRFECIRLRKLTLVGFSSTLFFFFCSLANCKQKTRYFFQKRIMVIRTMDFWLDNHQSQSHSFAAKSAHQDDRALLDCHFSTYECVWMFKILFEFAQIIYYVININTQTGLRRAFGFQVVIYIVECEHKAKLYSQEACSILASCVVVLYGSLHRLIHWCGSLITSTDVRDDHRKRACAHFDYIYSDRARAGGICRHLL